MVFKVVVGWKSVTDCSYSYDYFSCMWNPRCSWTYSSI
uniref:Uncharacterized protein n=1 Tax=Rhizophora mucronata TaxID=61149 RepID=A0A2P2QHZ4_RHIMU